MDFFTDAVRTLEILVQALSGKHSFYGTAAEFTVESRAGEGTEITMVLPAGGR